VRVRIDWRVCSIVAALIGLCAGTAVAQDSNYWSSAYGTRALLLGGVVTGSPGDISSVYYNPGAFALARNAELLLAGSAYQYQRVSVDGGSGPGRSLVSSVIAAVPSLFAGEIPVLKTDRLAYSFLGRQEVNLELDSRYTGSTPVLPPMTNQVFAATELGFKQNVSENWFGITWAHKLSPHLGIGASPYVAVRSQNTHASVFGETGDASNNLAVMNVSRDFDYLHWRALAKLGLSGVHDSLTYGVALTTPGAALFGGGQIRSNTTLVDQSGAVGNVAGANYQEDLKANYHSPLQVGAGASYGWRATRVHLAAEWNAEVPRYDVLHGSSYTVRTPLGDSTLTPVVEEKLDAVFNYGIGIEQRFRPTLIGYASFHTDNSGRDNSDPANASVTSWDLKHISGGVTWHVMRSDFTFGASTAFASQPVPPLPQTPAGTAAPPNLQSHVMMVTLLAGWKISF